MGSEAWTREILGSLRIGRNFWNDFHLSGLWTTRWILRLEGKTHQNYEPREIFRLAHFVCSFLQHHFFFSSPAFFATSLLIIPVAQGYVRTVLKWAYLEYACRNIS